MHVIILGVVTHILIRIILFSTILLDVIFKVLHHFFKDIIISEYFDTFSLCLVVWSGDLDFCSISYFAVRLSCLKPYELPNTAHIFVT